MIINKSHFLEIMPFDAVQKAFPRYEPETAFMAYQFWVNGFDRYARLFADVQLRAVMYKSFEYYCKVAGIEPSYYNYGAIETFDRGLADYRIQIGVADFERETESYFRQLNEYKRLASEPPSINEVSFADELLESLTSDYYSPRVSAYALASQLDEVWFNYIIANPDSMVAQLRNLSYPEYLQSWHWKRVRAAMLISKHCRCEGLNCGGADSYLDGDEQDLHVHHVTYKNRGNERFKDLVLLCKECHSRIHNGSTNIIDSEVTP